MICIIRTGMPGEAVPWVGVILAGGRGRRVGGRVQALLSLGGRALLDRAIERALPQVADLALNANGDAGRFSGWNLPVLADTVEGYAGPLAGVLTAMEWAVKGENSTGWVATFPVDAPFFPTDLVGRLSAAIADQGADIGRALSGGRAHPLFALWPVRLRHDLRKALVEEGVRGVQEWMARHKVVQVDFPTSPVDPFYNINSLEDLARAETLNIP